MIKKTTLLIALACLAFFSCTTDIEVSSPGLQAVIDGELFKSDTKKAILHEDGTLVITGTTGAKKMSFTTSSTNVGTYRLSQQAISQVSFQSNTSKFISTSQESNGEVVITEVYDNEITGHFFFKGLKNDDGTTMSFQNGWFYRLPIQNFVEEEEDENKPIQNPCLLNASLTATIDGTPIITDDHSAEAFGVQPPFPSIRITASNGTHDIEIVFSITSEPGQYQLEGSGDYSASYTIHTVKSSARSGILTITEHDQETKCISGSFEFTSRTGVEITGGDFDFGY